MGYVAYLNRLSPFRRYADFCALRAALGLSFALIAAGSHQSLAQFSDAPENTAIVTESLGAARAFNAGALDNRDAQLGLDLGIALWQNTSAPRAIALINAAPLRAEKPIIRDLIRAALLSAGEPPQGERETFEQARLSAVITLQDEAALAALSARNPALAQNPEFQVQNALVKQEIEPACAVSDQLTTGRAEPFWARLRIVCHILRDEISAAELTRDLLQSTDYKDPSYFTLLSQMIRKKSQTSSKRLPRPPALRNDDDALIYYMRDYVAGTLPRPATSPAIDEGPNAENQTPDEQARDNQTPDNQTPEAALEDIWANLQNLDAADFTQRLSDIAFNIDDINTSSSFDLQTAQALETPQGTGQLFLLARTGNLDALEAFLRRAPENLRPDLQDKMLDLMPVLSAQDMAALDLRGFAQKAIMARDVDTLRGLYGALEGDARQARIALAADALGNGFNFGPLGKDIDSRLSGENSQSQAKQVRAQRDAMLALAMGAQISDAARAALKGQALTTGRTLSAGDKAIMRAAVKSGAQAELVLLSAQHLEGPRLDTQSLAALVEYLNAAGLPQFAGRIAAQDFIADL